VRARVGDKRVLALVKAFLKAGILTEDALLKDTDTGTPQGSILSPLLSNVALSGLDEYFAQAPGGPATPSWGRAKRRRNGLPNHRLVRFADDWTLLVAGTREDALALREQAARVLAPMGLALSEEKTLITHIDEGVDFLGWRIQRHRKKGTDRSCVYTYPSKKALRAVMAKVKTLCRQVDTNHPLDVLLRRLNPLLRGWTAFFRPGVSSATFQFLDAYVWRRVAGWIRRKHPGISRKDFRRRYCDGGWWPRGQDTELFHTGVVRTTRYRYRGSVIPSPWPLTAA
jgi:RNA-directed DNA polymerase